MNVSFQLYSARNFLPWSQVLKRLGELGYAEVEGFPGVYDDAAAIRDLLDENGLTMPTAHTSINALENDFDQVSAVCETLGIRSIFCPFLDPDQRPADRAGWAAFADRLSAIHRKVAAAGLQFGWHNHDFEFGILADGSVPMQTILETAPDIDWEADIAWIVRGGADPLEWIDRHGQRITAAHVKDIAPVGECADEDGWADVGHGTMDWRGLVEALRRKTRTAWFVMEHDNPNDFDRFASRSIAALSDY